MQTVKGIPVSPGIVIARVFVLGEAETHVPHRDIDPSEVDAELARLDAALRDANADLILLRDRTEQQLGREAAKIFGFHLGLLQDPALLGPMRDRIRKDLINVELAVADSFKKVTDQFKAIGNEVFRQKANDVLDLERRVLGKLMGENESRLSKLSESVIIVDGDTGVVVIRPDERTLDEYRTQQDRFSAYRRVLRETAPLEAVTKCGQRIQLLGNIEFPHEVESVLANGGDGVGLYRTEFLYLTNDHEPSEDEQFQSYKRTLELLAGRPCTIRTLDLGADKYTQQRAHEPERNPFLGLRSIRYCLQNRELFKTQLRAILRASAFGPMKVMFPLVSTLMELRQAKMILNDVCEELDEEGIAFDRNLQTGIMVEVPSAALLARAFADECSFFSIGTNDLIQYTLAVDRGNERVANLYTGASPAVLYLVKQVIRSGRRAGIDVSLCGEVAGEAIYTMLLIGLGLRTLSLVPSQIPLIKRVIRSVDIEHCEQLARRVGSFDSERQVLNTLRDELRKIDPDSFGGWIAE